MRAIRRRGGFNRIHEITDFSKVYEEFCTFFQEQDYTLPWSSDIEPACIEGALRAECSVTKKYELLRTALFDGRKISKEPTDNFPFNTDAVISLLSGKKGKPAVIFCSEAYSEIDSINDKNSRGKTYILFNGLILNPNQLDPIKVHYRAPWCSM